MKAKDTALNEADIQYLSMLKEQWRQEGRREVAEWVNDNIAFANINLSYKQWKAFKKKRGL